MSGINPADGNAIPGTTPPLGPTPGSGVGVTNALVNFGQEYVWHCHILGHEEDDMMRPIIFEVAPPAPSAFSALQNGSTVTLSWTDNSASESGFNLQRSTDPQFGTLVDLIKNGSPSLPITAYGVPITVTDSGAPTGVPVYYRVQAEDDFLPQSPLAAPFQAQPMFSAWVTTQAGTMTTTTITAPPIVYGQNRVVTVSVAPAAATGNVTLSVDGGAPLTLALAGGSAVFTLATPAAGTHTLVANYAAQGAFAAGSVTGPLLVGQATPIITWATPAPISYGTALSGTQLNATASVPGAFVYALPPAPFSMREAKYCRPPSPRPIPSITRRLRQQSR